MTCRIMKIPYGEYRGQSKRELHCAPYFSLIADKFWAIFSAIFFISVDTNPKNALFF
jgi:hypothetical protein